MSQRYDSFFVKHNVKKPHREPDFKLGAYLFWWKEMVQLNTDRASMYKISFSPVDSSTEDKAWFYSGKYSKWLLYHEDDQQLIIDAFIDWTIVGGNK